MSFVVKAVKKVFKKVKKFVKKVVRSDWFKVVAVAALTVFTAGVAAGGWGAFTGVNSIGSFFGAVGSTMANGWTAIGNFVSGNGFNLGGTEAVATGAAEVGAGAGPEWAGGNSITGGNNLTSAGLTGVDTGVQAGSRIASASDIAAAGKPLGDITLAGATPISTAAVQTAKDMTTTGFWDGAKSMSQKFLGKLTKTFTEDSVAGTFLRQGIMGGIMGYYEEKDRERQEFYFRNRTVWGNAAFGSGGESLIMPTAKKKSIFERTPQEEQQIAQQQQQQQAPTAEQTFGQGNLLTPEQQVQNPAQQVQRSAQAQMPQPTQPPPTNRPPANRSLLFTPENEGIYNAV